MRKFRSLGGNHLQNGPTHRSHRQCLQDVAPRNSSHRHRTTSIGLRLPCVVCFLRVSALICSLLSAPCALRVEIFPAATSSPSSPPPAGTPTRARKAP